MADFLVTKSTSPKGPEGDHNRVDAVIVSCDSTTQARTIARAMFGGDSDWPNAGNPLGALDPGYPARNTWRVRITNPTTGKDLVDVSTTGHTTTDAAGTALAAALNDKAEINYAAYNAGTNVLTVAGAADGVGDHRVTVDVRNSDFPHGNLDFMYSSIVHLGAAGAALTVTLYQPTTNPGIGTYKFRRIL